MVKIFLENDFETGKFCEEEYSFYMKKIFNIDVEITKIENDSTIMLKVDKNISSIENDTINIQFSKGKGKIVSNSDIGMLIGIYRFFEEFGVKYVRPGRENEIIPSFSKEIFFEKEMSIIESASYNHRGVCIEGADSYENLKEFIDWLPKIGFNSFFIQFENPYSFFKRWYEHEFNPYIEKEMFSIEIAKMMSDKIDNEIKKRGVKHHRVGHGWTGEVLGYSSKYGWESGVILPENKKEFAAEIGGKRDLFNSAPILTSLCFSNDKVNKKMVDVIVEYAKEKKDVNYLHVWLSDANNNICECENCKKDIPSDQYVRFLNILDKKLTEENLDTKICFLLYHELLFAPEKEKIENVERFTMMFAPISRTFEKSYVNVKYDENIDVKKEYVRNNITLPNSLEENLSHLFQWQKVFEGDSFVYDYPLGRAHYGDLGYMKISKIIYEDIKYLENLSLNGYISCQELRAGFPHNFPNYVMGKTLWNKYLNYDNLKEEYFSGMYGKEWKKVEYYLENLSEYSSCDYFNAKGSRENYELSYKYKISKHLAYNFIDEIEKNIINLSGRQKEEWKNLSFHREYVIKMSSALHLLSSGDYLNGQRKWKDLLDYIRRTELSIQKNLDVYRVIEVAKNYTGFKI